MVVTKKATESQECIEKVSLLLQKLNIHYVEVTPFIEAFIHRSIVNEKPDFAPKHNERLEFLGDAVLELVITDNLFIQYPEKKEGELTDIRSSLVRWKNLAQVAKNLEFDKYLFLWNGEELSGGRTNEYILANTLEAFLWATYLDSGLVEVKKFIDTHIYASLQDMSDDKNFKDYKSLIQEFAQAEYDITPHYQLIDETWPDHDKIFEVGVYVWEILVGMWDWSSKKKAQESAAEKGYLSREEWKINP